MKRAAVVGIAAGATGAVLIAALAAWWLSARPPTADDAARAYLDALAGGDYAAIDDMTPSGLGGDEARWVEQAFAGASAYIADPRVVELDTSEEGVATVDAAVDLGGEARELSFTLQLSDGRWMLAPDHLGALNADALLGEAQVGDAVWVGDALVPSRVDVSVLPAEYEVQAAPRGILSGTATVAVSTDAPAEVVLDAALAPEATIAAQAQLDAYMDECARPADTVPDACGLRVPWAADLTALEAISFRIDERPVVELSDDGASFDATGGVIVATATGTPRADGPATVTYRADDWALRGSLRFSGDELILLVR